MCSYNDINVRTVEVAATGGVDAIARKCRLVRAFLMGGSVNSTASIADGTGGPVKGSFSALANTVSQQITFNEDMATSIFVIVTGTGAKLYVQYL